MELLDIVLRDASHVLQVIGIVEVLKLNYWLAVLPSCFCIRLYGTQDTLQCGLVLAMYWGGKRLPIVSIAVPFFGLTNSILRIPKGNPKKELQWRPKEGLNVEA